MGDKCNMKGAVLLEKVNKHRGTDLYGKPNEEYGIVQRHGECALRTGKQVASVLCRAVRILTASVSGAPVSGPGS